MGHYGQILKNRKKGVNSVLASVLFLIHILMNQKLLNLKIIIVMLYLLKEIS
jgi:hypothetical protein